MRIRLTFDLIPEVKVIVESDEEKKEDKAPGRKSARRQEPVVEESDVETAPATVEETVEPSAPEDTNEPAEEA